MEAGRVSRWLCMYQPWTYWLCKECIRLNIFSPLTLEVITLNASLNFHGWVMETMGGGGCKTQIGHICFIITQLGDRSVALKKSKDKLLKELGPVSYFPSLLQQRRTGLDFFFSFHTWHSGLWRWVCRHSLELNPVSGLKNLFPDGRTIFCSLADLGKLGPEVREPLIASCLGLPLCTFGHSNMYTIK